MTRGSFQISATFLDLPLQAASCSPPYLRVAARAHLNSLQIVKHRAFQGPSFPLSTSLHSATTSCN